MSQLYDNTNSSNPITMIAEIQEAFRKKLRQHTSTHIIKLKWIKNLDFEKAWTEYLGYVKSHGLLENWDNLQHKIIKEIKVEMNNICDEWMLESLAAFNIQQEMLQAFKAEWDLVGDKPRGLI